MLERMLPRRAESRRSGHLARDWQCVARFPWTRLLAGGLLERERGGRVASGLLISLPAIVMVVPPSRGVPLAGRVGGRN